MPSNGFIFDLAVALPLIVAFLIVFTVGRRRP
jgi:hypothetical protein